MLAGGGIIALALALGIAQPGFLALLPVWFLIGAGSSLIQTPAGRLLRRSCHAEDRPAIFAAQFALSHVAWLVTYPLAGLAGSALGLVWTFVLLGVMVVAATIAASRLWPREDLEVLEHEHAPIEHAHLHVHDEHHRHEHEGWEGPEPHRHRTGMCPSAITTATSSTCTTSTGRHEGPSAYGRAPTRSLSPHLADDHAGAGKRGWLQPIPRRLAETKGIRRYPMRKVTTPVPVEGGVAGGALRMSAGTSPHGRRKPNGRRASAAPWPGSRRRRSTGSGRCRH